MKYRQLVTPNLDPTVYNAGKILLDWYGWCLATIETAFGTARIYPNAWAAWLATTKKHEDKDFPRNVYFPIFFSGSNGDGHIALAYVNDNGQMGIWTSPYKHTPYFFTGYTSVDQLAAAYHVTFVGHSEDLAGTSIIEAVPDPTPPPAPVVEAVKPANITYTKLDNPIDLITNKQPTHWWGLGYTDYTNVVSQAELPINTPFTAYGKATRTDLDHPVYYMTEADFSQADVTGVPANNNGINTVDLSPAPVATPEPPVDIAVAVPVTTTETPTIASASPPLSPIVPVAPEKPVWQTTITNVADYRAIQDYEVDDLATDTPVSTLLTGQIVHAVVRFTKNDSLDRPVEYVMTQKSVDSGKFNGIPLAVLRVIKAIDIAEPDNDSMLQEIAESVKDFAEITIEKVKKDSVLREKIVALIARFVFRAKKTNKVKG